MPSYDYKCDCGNVQETQHGISATPEIRCNTCNQIMRKLPSAATAHFKGSGFYSTDKTQNK